MPPKHSMLCRSFSEDGYCKYGNNCIHAHFKHEMKPQPCRARHCKNSGKCRFLHHDETVDQYCTRLYIVFPEPVYWKGEVVQNPFCQLCQTVIEGTECPHQDCTYVHCTEQLRRRVNGETQQETFDRLVREGKEKAEKKAAKIAQKAEKDADEAAFNEAKAMLDNYVKADKIFDRMGALTDQEFIRGLDAIKSRLTLVQLEQFMQEFAYRQIFGDVAQ